MNKTQQLANEKFGGDINEAIKHIMLYVRNEELDQYIDEWTPEQARFAINSVYQLGLDKLGKDGVNKIIKDEIVLDEFNLTREEVINAKKNPFAAKIGKQLLKLFVVDGGVASLVGLMSSNGIENTESLLMTAALGAASIFTTYMASGIGTDIVKYFKFKKLKKELEKSEPTNTNDTLMEGKVL